MKPWESSWGRKALPGDGFLNSWWLAEEHMCWYKHCCPCVCNLLWSLQTAPVHYPFQCTSARSWGGAGRSSRSGLSSRSSYPLATRLQTFLPPPTSLTATACSSSETFSKFVFCRINPKCCWTQRPQHSGPRIFLSLSFPPFLKSTV